MSKVDNKAGKHIVCDSITVLKGINSPHIKSLQFNVNALASAQSALAADVQDYWTKLSDDGVITEEEKKTLYKEWRELVQGYIDLVNSAENKYGIPLSSTTLIAYKAAYADLYTLIIENLKLFDDMHQSTRLPDRAVFVKAYSDYYAAREALRLAIMEGEDAKIASRVTAVETQEAQVQQALLGGLAESAVDYERYQSGLEQRLAESDTRLSMLVSAGGSDAFFGMSVMLPYFIFATKYTEWQTALTGDQSGLDYLAAVYERVNIAAAGDPVYVYRLKSDATGAQIKSLTNKLRALNKLSSTITLSADMVQVDGTSVFSSGNTLANLKDYIGASIAALLQNASGTAARFDGSTIVDGGFIKTDMIDVAMLAAKSAFINALCAQTLELQTDGVIKSSNYAANTAGFLISANGDVEFNNAVVRGTTYAKDIVFQNVAAGEYALGIFGFQAVSALAQNRTFTVAFPGNYKLVVEARANSLANDKTIYIKKNGTAVISLTPSAADGYRVSYTEIVELVRGDVMTAYTEPGRTARCGVVVTVYTDLRTDGFLYALSQDGFSGGALDLSY